MEKVIEFTKRRYVNLKGIKTECPCTAGEATKSQIDLLTCPIVVSTEGLEYGREIAGYGEMITLGVLAMEADGSTGFAVNGMVLLDGGASQ